MATGSNGDDGGGKDKLVVSELPGVIPSGMAPGSHVRRYYDTEHARRLVFLKNNFTLPAINIAGP